MIKIRRNCKEIERKSFGAKTGQKQGSARFRSLCKISILLQNQFAASGPSLWNHFWHTSAILQHSDSHFAAAKRLWTTKAWKIPFSQGKLHSAKDFTAAKPLFGTRVPFRSCETAAKCQSVKTPNFRNQSPISQGVSQLWNHFLAHEYHLEAPYTHFAAAKWLRNLHTLKSFSAHTKNRHVTTTPPFRQLLDTSRSLPEVQIMHTIYRFKAWEVRSPVLQTVRDLEMKWRSYGRLKTSMQTWAGISQPRRHLEGCFAAAKPLFGTRVPFAAQFPHFEAAIWLRNHLWAAKSLLSYEMECENSPPLRNPPPAAKMLQASKMVCEHATLLRNDLQASKWLRNDLQA